MNASQNSHCIETETPNTRILFNTMVDASGGGVSNIALAVKGANCTVMNNIVLELSSAIFVAYDLGVTGETPGLVSDYNILYAPDGHGNIGLVRRDGVIFASLAGFQATGFDTHSFNRPVVFVDEFHLDGCQAQDPALNGKPIPGIITDLDNQLRNPIIPMKGADEAERTSYDMFGAGFRAGLSGTPFSLVAGDFDGDQDDDIAIPDYDHRRVLLYRNQGASRSFINFGIIPTNTAPGVLKLFDWDRDGKKDLIVAGDTSAVEVFWGDGAGTFSGGYNIVGTLGRVRSIEPAPILVHPDGNLIWVAEDGGLGSNQGFLGAIISRPGRDLCSVTTVLNDGSVIRDTIPAALCALATVELGQNNNALELVALGIGGGGLFTFTDIGAHLFGVPPNVGPCDPKVSEDHVEQQFGTAPYLGFASNIAVGDFDGDGDKDLITTSAFENGLIFVHNLGGVTLGAPDTIPSTQTRAVVALDYEGDGDLDIIAANRTLEQYGITVYLNGGAGNFLVKPNCFFPFASGFPNGMIASDFDRDGKTDLAIASSFDSLFVVYNLGGAGVPVGVGDRREPASGTIALAQNVPNPFGPSTRIPYTLPAKSHVTLKIYSVLCQEIATLVDEEQSPGSHGVTWTGSTTRGAPVGAGVYFYRLEAKEPNGIVRLAGAKRMIVLR